MTKKAKAREKAPKGLSERHRRFVELYMGECAGVGVEAAKRAGYKGTRKVLSETARKILARKDVQDALEQRVKDDPTVANRSDRQAFWTSVMKGDELVPHGKAKRMGPPSMRDRLLASQLLGRSQGDFVELHRHKHEVNGEVRVQHVTELPPVNPPPDPGPDA